MSLTINMKYTLQISRKIEELAPGLKGVLSVSDLKNLIGPCNDRMFYRVLTQLSEAGIMSSFCRGFYVTPGFDIQVLSQRICADSYISFGSVLAKNLIIGSVPTYRLRAVKAGPSKNYSNSEYTIEQVRITPGLFMGYENIKGVNIATPEKAFLDILYYYQKGMKFSFDIYSDIDYDAFDRKRIEDYLRSYKNQKYVAFVKGVLDG